MRKWLTTPGSIALAIIALVFIFPFMPLPSAWHTAAADGNPYGTTDFQASGDPQAHALFIRGLVMLHNFEYEDAREVFQQARDLDPDFVMAYWGEALTYENPLWNQQDLPKARAVLKQLGPTDEARVERAKTDREKAYIQSVNILFGEGPAVERDYAYSAALKEISETWPEDIDARALYALSVLTTSHDGRDFYKFIRAGAITEELMDRAPRHPGVVHYNIHSYDDPIHAPLGRRAADVYSEIAPAAAHALHMPSHIYFALGDYQRASDLNMRSFQASVERAEKKNVPYDIQAYHSLTWLVYSRLQENKVAEARRLVGIAEQQWRKVDSPANRNGFITCRSNYIIDTQKWDDPLLDIEVSHARVARFVVAMDQYVMGMRALKQNDMDKAKNLLHSFPLATNPCQCRCKTPHLCRIKIPQFVDGGRSLRLAECHTTEDAVRLVSTDGGYRGDYLGESIHASRTACTRRVHQRHCPPNGTGPQNGQTSLGRGDPTTGVQTENVARLAAGSLHGVSADPSCRVSGIIRCAAFAGDTSTGVHGRIHHPDRLPAHHPATEGGRL